MHVVHICHMWLSNHRSGVPCCSEQKVRMACIEGPLLPLSVVSSGDIAKPVVVVVVVVVVVFG